MAPVPSVQDCLDDALAMFKTLAEFLVEDVDCAPPNLNCERRADRRRTGRETMTEGRFATPRVTLFGTTTLFSQIFSVATQTLAKAGLSR